MADICFSKIFKEISSFQKNNPIGKGKIVIVLVNLRT